MRAATRGAPGDEGKPSGFSLIPLKEDTSPALQVVVDALLDGVAHLVGERHHKVVVVGCLWRVLLDMDWGAELDPRLARQRDHAERAHARPRWRDGEVGQPENPRQGGNVRNHWIDFFGADHLNGNDRRP